MGTGAAYLTLDIGEAEVEDGCLLGAKAGGRLQVLDEGVNLVIDHVPDQCGHGRKETDQAIHLCLQLDEDLNALDEYGPNGLL
jgi:hypothetical protein